MKKLFISLLLNVIFSYCINAQDAVLSFIDDDEKDFFRNNGWELYYGSDDIKFYDFIIHNGELVVAEIEGEDYRIHFFNQDRLIEKRKTVNGRSQPSPFIPSLYEDAGNIVFAPIQKFECVIIPEKERIKKKNRLKSLFSPSRDEYFKKYRHYQGLTFYTFATVDDASGIQYVVTKFGENDRKLSNFYTASIKSDVLTYTTGIDRVEIEFLNNKVFLADNFSDELLLFDVSGKEYLRLPFKEFCDPNVAGYSLDVNLLKDEINNKIYTVYRGVINEVLYTDKVFKFIPMNLNIDFRLHKPRVNNGYLYALIYSDKTEGRAIYRKKLE
ncbi:MAG: hypothetical protein ACQETL_17805 [Bacteroidota bacterium]